MELGLFNDTLHAVADYEILLRAVQIGLKSIHVPEFLSCFYQNTTGITQNSSRSAAEENEVRDSFRKAISIERIFPVEPTNREQCADAWTALGNVAACFFVPWHNAHSEDLDYAIHCYRQALEADPHSHAARYNLCHALLLRNRREELNVTLASASNESAEQILAALANPHPQRISSPLEAHLPPLLFNPPAPAFTGNRFEVLAEPVLHANRKSDEIFTVADQKKPSPEIAAPLRWLAPFFNPSGYASEAIQYALGLHGKLQLGIFHHNNVYSENFLNGLPENEREILLQLQANYSGIRGGFSVNHNPANGFLHPEDSEYWIGRTMFETDRISASWVAQCNRMDEIWVPSRFNVETFAACGVDPDKLHVIHQSVNSEQFHPDRYEPLLLPNRAGFNFLSIFEWSSRKAWDVLLAAYLREFSAEDDVCLYLRAAIKDQPDADPREIIHTQLREFAASLHLGNKPWPRIELIHEQVPLAHLPRLYKAADCLVAPTRGEGWGRPIHEAMMMGLPVVATNWSGNTEFMNPDIGYLLDYELIDIRGMEPEMWHYRGHRWANPCEQHLRETLRHIQQNPSEAQSKGRKARVHMERHFSSAPVTRQILGRLKAIEEKLSTPALPAVLARQIEASSAPAINKTLPVAWEGSYLDFGSLSHVNRQLTSRLAGKERFQLSTLGKNVIPPGLADIPEIQATARQLRNRPSSQPRITVRHQWPPHLEKPDHGALVVMQPWEFGALPAEWVRKLERADAVWANSSYLRKVYIDSGVSAEKIQIVPLGIDPDRFHPQAEPLKLSTNKKFRFLFVGGTIHRKGPDLLLEAYLKNFTCQDDVVLVIKDFGNDSIYAGQTLENRIREIQLMPGAPEILYLKEELTPEEMPGLYTACHCLVHPYRGEGFGLPVLEAMACGRAVIVSGGGATDDFATDQFAYRIPTRRKTLGMEIGGMRLARPGWWLEPDSEELASTMVHLFRNPAEGFEKGSAASAHVREFWTWDRSATIAASHLAELAEAQEEKRSALLKRRARRAAPLQLPPAGRLGELTPARKTMEQNHLVEAWNLCLQSMEQRPYHPEAWLLMAEIAHQAGETQKARQCAEQSRRLAPKWKPAARFLKSLPAQGTSATRNEPGPLPHLPTLPERPRLTVCLITKNEETFLPRCLKSVENLAGQIVLVDTGSTDRTLEIAQQFGADLHHFPWNGNFSDARNEALLHARGDWILCLDADEELQEGQASNLIKAMEQKNVMAWRLPIIDIGKEDEGCSYVPRLFRNAPGLFYVGRIHEQVFSSVEVRREEWGLENKLGQAMILHHGYREEVVKIRRKVARNLKLLEQAVEEFPNEPNLLMNFGMELVRAGQLEAGLIEYREAYELLSEKPRNEVVPELRETLLTQFATQLLSAGQYDEVHSVLDSKLVKRGGRTASMHFIYGVALLESSLHEPALEQFRQCLAKRNQPVLSPINKEIHKAGPHHCMAVCLWKLGQPDAAGKAFREALKIDPASRNARMDYARYHVSTHHPLEALKILHQLISEQADDFAAWQAGAQIALNTPGYQEFAKDWTSEALKFFPENPAAARWHAEALLLNQEPAKALIHWRKLAATKPTSVHLSAMYLCEILEGRELTPIQHPLDREAVSREFLRWYKRCIETGAGEMLMRMNDRMEILEAHLPGAARALQAAMAEAAA